MLFRGLAILASVAAAASGIQRRQSDDDYNWSRNDVLGLPDKVQAGEETIFRFNFSRATRRSIFNEDGYRKAQVLLSRYIDEDRGLAQVWCVLEPCVLPNVTSIRTTIPREAFPDDADMILKTRPFDTPSQDDPKEFNYTAFISDHLDFELEGGEAELSDWEKEHGWEIVAQGFQVPCSKVPCVRSCVEEHLDVDQGNSEYRQSNMDKFEECATECGVKERTDPESFVGECISENGERSTSESDSSGGNSSGNSGSNSDNDADEEDGDGSDEDNSGSSNDDGDDDNEEDGAARLGGLSTMSLLGGLVIYAVLAA